jgi:hypothetical protein
LFRLWVVFTVLWVAGASYVFYDASQSMKPRDFGQGVYRSDLDPRYHACGVRRSADDRVFRPLDANDPNVKQFAECQLRIDRLELLQTAAVTIVAVPVAILFIGWLLLWAARGFVAS